jgi:mono/diheme cytochrome c family protein
MNLKRSKWAAIAAVAVLTITSIVSAVAADTQTPLSKGQLIEHGRYVLLLGGCNDCHTAGYGESGGKTPEKERLMGNPMGFTGPWGTTYASNLRLYFQTMTEDEWVKKARTLQTPPPMPWFTLNAITETDLRSIHAYIASLGSAGKPAPHDTPPGK